MSENKLFPIALCLDLISVEHKDIKELRILHHLIQNLINYDNLTDEYYDYFFKNSIAKEPKIEDILEGK